MALLVTWGTGLEGSEIRMPCCPRLVDATWQKDESPFKFTFVYRPRQSWLFVLFSLFCPPTSKGHIFSTALADLGEFYVKSKGFPCSTQKSSDFGRMDEKKEGAFLPHVGPFQG